MIHFDDRIEDHPGFLRPGRERRSNRIGSIPAGLRQNERGVRYLLVIAFLAVGLFIRDPAGAPRILEADMRSPGLPGLEAGEAVRSPDFWKLAVVFLCIPIVVNGTVVHLVPLLTDRG